MTHELPVIATDIWYSLLSS